MTLNSIHKYIIEDIKYNYYKYIDKRLCICSGTTKISHSLCVPPRKHMNSVLRHDYPKPV